MYLVTLEIDISCTPGGVTDEIDGVFSDKALAEERCELLNKELDKELGIDDSEKIASLREDHPDDCDGLTDEEVREQFETLFDEDEWEDDDFRGYTLSGQPYWCVCPVTVKG